MFAYELCWLIAEWSTGVPKCDYEMIFKNTFLKCNILLTNPKKLKVICFGCV